jgi:hypothetical protein
VPKPCASLKRRRWHVGSQWWLEQHAHLPPGPADADEFGEWPLHLAQTFFRNLVGESDCQGELRLYRTLRLLENGLVLHTDYSGKQCPEVTLRLWALGVLQHMQKVDHPALAKLDASSWPCVVSWRACDISRLSQKVICEGRHKPLHYFEDVASRLPDDVREHLDGLRPDPKADVAVRQAAFETMSAYLDTVKETVFTREAKAPCKIHPDCLCPLNWKDPQMPAGKRPLTMNLSGPVCLPWSQLGKEEGMAHMATEAWLIWIKDLEQQMFDFSFLENSKKMPVNLFGDGVGKHCAVISVVHGPEVMGWPVNRSRLLASGLRRETLVWLGPLDGEAIGQHFQEFVRRRAVVDASIFAGTDSEDHVEQERRFRGEAARLEGDAALHSDLVDYFSTAASKTRALEYMKVVSDRAGPLSDAVVIDMSQDPTKRCRASPWLMTLARSSDMVLLRDSNDKKGYFFTPSEIAFSQGWPLQSRPTSKKYMECCSYPLDTLPHAQQRSLQGNGMHLTALASFMAYIFAHTIQRDVVAEYLPPLKNLDSPPHDRQDADDPRDGQTIAKRSKRRLTVNKSSFEFM